MNRFKQGKSNISHDDSTLPNTVLWTLNEIRWCIILEFPVSIDRLVYSNACQYIVEDSTYTYRSPSAEHASMLTARNSLARLRC